MQPGLAKIYFQTTCAIKLLSRLTFLPNHNQCFIIWGTKTKRFLFPVFALILKKLGNENEGLPNKDLFSVAVKRDREYASKM